MNIKTIELDDEGDLVSVTVRMSAQEAAYLAALTEQQSEATNNALMANGDMHGMAVFGALNHGLFAKFYLDGVQQFLRRCTPEKES